MSDAQHPQTATQAATSLLSLVTRAWENWPDAFPTRSSYLAMSELERRVGTTLGWDISDDPHIPGDLAIQSDALDEIIQTYSKPGTLAIPQRQALRQLARLGRIPLHEDQRLTYRLYLAQDLPNPRVYLFRLTTPDDPVKNATEMHEALKQASKATQRAACEIINEALQDWLTEHGYLAAPAIAREDRTEAHS